ncbi:MAG: DMT family transporter [Myxococcota bacterium]
MQSQYQPRSGVHYLLLYAFLFSLMGVCVKLVAHLPSQLIVSARIVVTLVATASLLGLKRVPVLGNNRKTLILRGITGTLALNCYFYAMAHMPIAEAILIQNTTPVFTGLLAAVFLRERRHWSVGLTTVASLVGVLIMTRPETIFGASQARMDLLPVVCALAGAIFTASSFVIIRRLGTNEHPLVVVFYTPLVGVFLTLPFTVNGFVMPSAREWIVLGVLGIITQLGQMALSVGIRREPVARVTNLTHAQLVFATIWGALLFNEYPDGWTLIGATVVVGASVITVLAARADNSGPSPGDFATTTSERMSSLQALVPEPSETDEPRPRHSAAELSQARTPTS